LARPRGFEPLTLGLEKHGFKVCVENPHFKTIEENNNYILNEEMHAGL